MIRLKLFIFHDRTFLTLAIGPLNFYQAIFYFRAHDTPFTQKSTLYQKNQTLQQNKIINIYTPTPHTLFNSTTPL